MRAGGIGHRALVGFGLLLVGVVAGLLLVGVNDPVLGLAAPVPDSAPPLAPRSLSPLTQAMTSTVYLPFISRQESIAANVWRGEYYANVNLEGIPAYTTTEARVDHSWGTGAPAGLPENRFSIRWTGYWDFEIGRYTFFILADDGIRLWLDDQLIIDDWQEGWAPRQKTVLIETAGLHYVKLEYFEQTSVATIRIHWRRTDLYPQWHGDYYTQPWVESGWLYEQDDSAIQFDWGDDCPTGLPCDGFSIAWEAKPTFEAGTHRLYLYADEGYQLFVDGTKVKEGGWYDGQSGGSEDASYDLEIAELGSHQITYNFHDRGGPAEARLWIENLEHPYWTAEYYGNMSLGGSPVVTKQEPAIFYDWGYDKAYAKLPSADHFSARWTGQRYFCAGFYRFGLYADDGVRLWVDGELLVDEWQDATAEYHSPVTYLATGYHDVVVEYYENAGEAEIRFWWE